MSSLSAAIFVNVNINLASAKKSSHSSGDDSNDKGNEDIISSNAGNGDGGSGGTITTPSTDQENITSSTTSINAAPLIPQQQYQQCVMGIGGAIPGNCKPPSPSSTTTEQNFGPQTLTPQKCQLLPTDANGNCQRIDMQDGSSGLPPQLGSQEKQAHYNLPYEVTHVKQFPDGSCPPDYHYSTNSSSDRYCLINVYQKNPDGSCPIGIIMTTNNECVKMPVLPGTSTGSGGGFIQMFPTHPATSPPATSPTNTTPYLPPPATK